MDGLSIKDELFAIRLLELARTLQPEGNRVQFVRFCESHGIRTFLQGFPELWKTITDDPPRDGVTPNSQFRMGNAAFCLKQAAFQEHLLDKLEVLGVRTLAIKGPSLSSVLYGDITKREFGDIDLLVPPSEIRRVVDFLDAEGLRRTYPGKLQAGQELAFFRYSKAQSYFHSEFRGSLDLHWRLLSAWVGADILPFERLWERRQVLNHESLRPWASLGNEDTIVFLALHGFQDGWPKLKQILELAVALEVLDFDWQAMIEHAGPRAVLVERAIELCVHLTGVPHPERMTYYYSGPQAALETWLEMAKAPKSPQGNLLKPGLWSCHSSEALMRSLQALLNPSIEDITSTELPLNLVGMYPFIRLFRLVKKALNR